MPLPFLDGTFKAVSYATDWAVGFTETEIGFFEAVRPYVAVNEEAIHIHQITRTLLDTYVGPVAGKRALYGAIGRGTQETIRAAIWFCDLKGFTAQSESLSVRRVLTAACVACDAMTDRLGKGRAAGVPKVEFGIALQFGDVFYGNVGGETRLDFTVIGPAVNLASRIEALTRNLDRPILVSEAFKALHEGPFDANGLV